MIKYFDSYNNNFSVKRAYTVLFSLLLILTSGGISHAAERLTVDRSLTKIDIGRYVDYYEDRTDRLTIDDISSVMFQNKFIRSTEERIGFGYSRSTYWLRIKTDNRENHEIIWFLECTYNLLDFISLYVPGADGFTATETGDNLPFMSRPIPNRSFVFPINQEQGSLTLYLMVKSGGSLAVPLIAWKPSAFMAEKDKEAILLWLSFGILMALGFYNLFIYFSIKEKSYIYLVFVMMSFIFYALTHSGIAYQYLWPNSPHWNNSCYPFFTFLVIIGTLLFTRAFLDTGKNLPKFDKVYKFILIFCVPCSLLPFFIEYYYAIQLVVLTAIAASVAMISGGFVALVKKIRPAYFYMISWSFFIIGSLMILLRVYAILPENIITAWSFQIGFVVMSLMFSLGIADNINRIQSEKIKAVEELKASEEKYRTIFENATEGIFQTTPNGKILTANAALARILGFDSPGELKSNAPDIAAKLFVDQKRRDEFAKIISSKGQVKGFEFNVYRKDGSIISLSLNAHIVYDSRGKLLYYEGMLEDITKKKEAEELERRNILLKQQAITDGLTGLYTHKYIMERLMQEVSEARRYGNKLAVALLDIDFFKRINDMYGHQMGDKIIAKISETMKNNLREVDIIGRYGGEEFLIIYPNTNGREAFISAERIRIKIENLTWDYDITATISGGIATFESENTEDIINKADKFLYIAKHSGRNRIEL